MPDKKPAATIDLDEAVPKTLQLDDESAGEGASKEPTEESMPASTPTLRASVKSGVSKMQPPTKFEEGKTIPEDYGFTPGNILSHAWQGVKNVGGFAKDLASDISNEKKPLLFGGAEEGPEESTFHKYVIHPSEDQFKEAQSGDQTGLESIGHSVAGALPMIGPWVAGHAKQAGTGDIGGAAGETLGEMAGGKALEHAVTHPIETAKLPLRIADKVARGTPITEAGRLEAAKQQALAVKKPSMTETDYAAQTEAALPELQRIAQDNKGKIKTPRQATQAINDRISQIEAPISDHIKGLTGDNALVHPDQYQGAINKALDAELSKRPGSYKPAEIEKAKKSVMDFIGDQPKTLEEIEGNRKRLNQDAESYFNTDTAGKRAIDVSDATAVAQRAAAHAIRDVLYGDGTQPGALENAGVSAVDVAGKQVPIRDLRKTVGRLIDVRDHFEDAITKAEATGDWHMFDVAKKGPSLAAGGIGMVAGGAAGGLPGAILGTLLGEGAKAWADYRSSKNPNLNVQKMFRNLEDTGKPNTVDVQTRQPIRQYPQPIGPQQAAHLEPIGPQLPPQEFELGAIQPKTQAGLWAQHVGQPPDLTWGGPNPPYFEPAGPKQAPAEAPLPPIQGEQMPLDLPTPPENAPLFSMQQTPRVGEPAAPAPSAPETLPPIGGPGREGVLEPINAPKAPGEALKLGEGEDLGKGLGTEHIITKGGKRVGSITVEPRADGVLHVHWLGGEFTPADRGPITDILKKEYPETEKITYDRRRLAKGAEAATTEAREAPLKKKSESEPIGKKWDELSPAEQGEVAAAQDIRSNRSEQPEGFQGELIKKHGEPTEEGTASFVTLKEPETFYHGGPKGHSIEELKPNIPDEVANDPDLEDEEKESARGIYLSNEDVAGEYAKHRYGLGDVSSTTLPKGTKVYLDPVDSEGVFVKELPAKASEAPDLTSEKSRMRKLNLKHVGIPLDEMDPKDAEHWLGYTGQKTMKVYRGTTGGEAMQPGDYVTTSRESAEGYGGKVEEVEVSPADLRYVRGHINGDPKSVGLGGQTELLYAPKKKGR